LNGTAGAGVVAPAPVIGLQQIAGEHEANNGNGKPKRTREETELMLRQDQNHLEQWRFMPVMSIDQALERRQAIVQATQKLMQEGVDYGKIPGGDKPALLQPGADKLCNLFGLVVKYEVTKCEEDWTGLEHDGVPFFFYELKGRAYRGDYLMGEGMGSCNSWEENAAWVARKRARRPPRRA
jgi:hypothetical protein